MAPQPPAPAPGRGVDDRGVTDTSLFPPNPQFEDVTVRADGTVDVGQCRREIPAEDDRLYHLAGLYTVPGLDGTPCLFAFAGAMAARLPRLRDDQPLYDRYVQRLAGMAATLRARTRGPYRIGYDTRDRAPLPPQVLATPPFTDAGRWASEAAAAARGRLYAAEPLPIVAPPPVPEPDEDAAAAAQIEIERLAQSISVNARTPRGLGATPQIARAVAILNAVTPADIGRQTGTTFTGLAADQPLARYTEVILYHSVYAVVLDSRGEPVDVGSWLRYPILVPEPGSNMARHLHPPGLYVSIRRLGGGAYRIAGGRIDKVVSGGIGALRKELPTAPEGSIPHPLEERIQQHLDHVGHSYAAAVVGPFTRNELSLENVRRTLPRLVAATVPYLVREAIAAAERTYDNWDDVAADLGVDIIKSAILGEAKDQAVAYLVRKIGTRVIPLVNVGAAIADVVDDSEARAVRHAVACVQMAVQGTTSDDLHVAAKVVAKILVKEAKAKLLEAIADAAAKGGRKLVRRGVARLRSGPAEESGSDESAPVDKPAPADEPPANPGQADPSRAAPSGSEVLREEIPDGSEAAARPPVASMAPVALRRADEPAPAAGTEQPATADRGTAAPSPPESTATPPQRPQQSQRGVTPTEPDGAGKWTQPTPARRPKPAKGAAAEEENAPTPVSARRGGKRRPGKGAPRPGGDGEHDEGKGSPRATAQPATDDRGGVPGPGAGDVDAVAPSVAGRVSGGTWERRGASVDVNDGCYSLPRDWDPTEGWRTYENGVNEVLPQMARDVTDRTVRVDPADMPTIPGRRSPSTQTTTRFKYQKGRRGGGLTRFPDATMEVVSRKGGTDVVDEVHHWEVTTEHDFAAAIGRPGHKRRQIWATSIIATQAGRKGYTADTRVYYHIISPDPPSDRTVAFLDELSATFPQVEFVWFVVR